MDEVVTEKVVDVLYEHCHKETTVTDKHLERVPVPDTFWGVSLRDMPSSQQGVATFLFRKRLSDVVSEWKNTDKGGKWQTSFVIYQ